MDRFRFNVGTVVRVFEFYDNDYIVKKLQFLLNNVTLRKTTSHNAVSTANNFKIEKMLSQHLNYLNLD